MKALSIRQPWAWLIVRPDLTGQQRLDALAHGAIKDIENRTWYTAHRGPTLIHAAKGMTRREYEDVEDFLHLSSSEHLRSVKLPEFAQLQRGGLVGIASIVDCVPARQRTSAWHMDGCYGFVIHDASPIPFVPLNGRLMLFDVPEEMTKPTSIDASSVCEIPR
ncbi:ASCH domain-containing protein [Ralstonia sp. ASV6]|uniref:ASCH domain-containing protein n=1 Tax=Ralstonia sp. ASV6 TaxID=2795124 RepID=UPI0018EE3FA2|nr:ASCH domain-containing protein [Ralstonia sp. ASV6]